MKVHEFSSIIAGGKSTTKGEPTATTIVAVFAICDDVLRTLCHTEDCRVQMADVEVMVTAIIAMPYFSGNFERSRNFLKEMGLSPRC